MGTICATNYAKMFMGKFERNLIELEDIHVFKHFKFLPIRQWPHGGHIVCLVDYVYLLHLC